MNFKSWYARPLMRVNRVVAQRVRSSPLLTRKLFGVTPIRGNRPQFWDYTTLMLKRALAEYGASGQRTLEVGVGENAILSQFLCKRFSVEAFGVDLDADALTLAARSAAKNKVEIDLSVSDMFSTCAGTFDLIFWNPPYVPTEAPDEGLVGKQSDIQSDGGNEGVEVIARFLAEAPAYLRIGGALLLGFSTFYIPQRKLTEIIVNSELRTERMLSAWPNPSKVVVLRHKHG